MKKMNFTFKSILVGFMFLTVGLVSVSAQVTITRTWTPGFFPAEDGWEIINTATNVVYECDQSGQNTPNSVLNLNVPPGTYQVRGFDSYGDGWNGSVLTITQGPVTLFTTSGPPGTGFNPGNNTCPGPSPVNGVSSAILGTFTVTAPACVLSCPSNITVNNDPGQCGAVVNYTVGSTNCTGAINYSTPSGAQFPVGTTTVTVSADGGLVTCSFNVTVNDNEFPKINCPSDIIVTLGPGECSQYVNYNVTATDNCPYYYPVIFTQNPPNNNPAQAIDPALSLNCGFAQTKFGRVFGGPGQPSVIISGLQVGIRTGGGSYTFRIYQLTSGTAPAAGNANLLPLNAAYTVNLPAVNAAYVPVTFPSPVTIPAGARYFVEIISNFGDYTMGNISAPDLPGTPSYIASAACGLPNYLTFAGVGFPDLSLAFNVVALEPGPLPVTLTAGLASGAEFPLGTTQVCYSTIDNSGKTASCCFNVELKEYPNPTNTLACNDLVQISLDEDCISPINADQILEGGPYGCYDNYIVNLVTPTGGMLPGVVNASHIGNGPHTVKVTDPKTGQSCWGKVIVEDKLPPVLECRDVVIACNGDLPTVPAPALVGPQIQIQQPFEIIENGPGTSPRIYTFDYSSLPAGTPALDVDVRIKLTGHTWLPDLTIRLTAPDGTSGNIMTIGGCVGQEWPIDVWFDDTGVSIQGLCVNLDQGGGPLLPQAGGVDNPGLIQIFEGGNASGTWTLRIEDSFPADDGIIEEVGLAINVNLPEIVPTDNCSNPVNLTYTDSFTDGDCGGPSGTVIRTWTATDASGNHTSCNQEITLERPTLDDVEVPLDIQWTCDQYNAFENVTSATPLHPYITDTDLSTVIINVNLDPACDDDDLTNQSGSKDHPGVNSTNVANGGNGCPGDVFTSYAAPGQNSGLDDADVLALTGSGVPSIDGKPLEELCGISYEHVDLYVNVCPGTFKIVRKWTLIDWCANPVDVREINQVIKVVDEVPPTISAPTDLTIDVYAASIPPSGGPHAVCEGTFAVPPATNITDNCSGVASYTTEIWTINAQGQPVNVLKTISGNGGVFTGIPMYVNGAPAMYVVRYYATDGCGNQGYDDMKITLRDKVPPVAVCDEITEVAITNNGLGTGQSCSTLHAEDLDDGSYDNCGPVYFLIAKMDDSFSPNIFNRCYYPTRDFCCEDLGNQTVIVLVLDRDPKPFFSNLNSPSLGCDGTPGLFLTTSFSAANYNTCMVTVQVTDKLPPIRISCPADVRIDCDQYANTLETVLAGKTGAEQCQILTNLGYGEATFYDNCSLNITCNTTISLDQCLDGTITRTWTATDNAGNAGLQNCQHRIFVDHVSDWSVEFPADITVTCGNNTPDFGEPIIFKETCELVAVSYHDEVFNVVPDACYKLLRTWTVINWCVVGANIDQEVVELSEAQLWNQGVTNLGDRDINMDGFFNASEANSNKSHRTYRDSWNNTPGKKKKPVRADNVSFGPITDPDTDTDSDPWDGYITYQQVIKVIDNVDPVFTNGCSIPDICITDNTCGATILLPTPEITECSDLVTITAQIKIGGVWLNGFGPYLNVAPGTYEVRYNAKDNCNNQTDCHTTVTVKDCKKPTPYCKNGLVIEIDPPDPHIQIWASDFNAGSFDNCPGTLKISFSANVNDISRTYYCDDIGQQPVQIWVTDAAGNQDYCETFVIIQDNLGVCDDDPLVAGATKTEDNLGVQNVAVSVNAANGSFNQAATTDAAGAYNFASVPSGGDYTITPTLDTNPLNGVSTFDLVLISKHILGVQPLGSPYKIIAADANKSNSVTTFDLVEIRKLILFINTDFPNNTSWRFVDKNFVFPNPSNPFQTQFPEVVNLNDLAGDQPNNNFVAVKVGDVNGSAATNLLGSNEDRTMVGDLVFNAEEVQMNAGETYTVEFKATDFNVSGYQFTLNYDRTALEFVEVGNGVADASNFGMSLLNEGVITASWNSENAKQLAAGEVVFSLVFKAKQSGRMSEELSINSRYTAAEAYNANAELMNVALMFNNTLVADGFELYQNTPNPFSGVTTIGFYLPEATSAKLTISDVQGKVVKVIEGDYAKGYNQVSLQRSELGTTGVMYYRLDSGVDSATRKMILVD